MSKNNVDIAIVGAGIVGCLLAVLLRKKLPHKTIALIDKQAAEAGNVDDEIDSRVYAINHTSQYLLEKAGVWSKIKQLHLSPYKSMHVWQDVPDQGLSFHADDISEQNLGHIVAHKVLHQALWSSLQACPQIRLYCPAIVRRINRQSKQALVLELDNGELIAARLVAAADGARSSMRDMHNIRIDKNSYLQSALVATVKTQQPHQHAAWQRFCSTGPLAFLPLQNGQSSIVWSLPHVKALQLVACSEDDFNEALSQHSQMHLGKVNVLSQRILFPLQQLQAGDYVKPRLALVGDAAHVVHPLAGQGLNLGLNDVGQLTNVLCQADALQADLGHLHILKRYARRSQIHNRVMAEAFGGLNSLFTSQHPLLSQARLYGFDLVNRSTALKRFFIQRAAGRI